MREHTDNERALHGAGSDGACGLFTFIFQLQRRRADGTNFRSNPGQTFTWCYMAGFGGLDNIFLFYISFFVSLSSCLSVFLSIFLLSFQNQCPLGV